LIGFTETNQLGKSRNYEYDSVGNLTKLTDRNGRVTDYVYDDLYRLDQEIWRNSSGGAIRTIDMNYNESSQLLRAADSDGYGVRSEYNFWYSRSIGATDRGSLRPATTYFDYGYGAIDTQLSAEYW